MGYFKYIYQGYPLEGAVTEASMSLRATSGSYPGQTPDDTMTLNLNARSPRFFFDPNNDPEDDVAAWIEPFLDTQWLEIPIDRFKGRDFRSLENIHVDFRGEGTPNALTGEDWWEAPGLISAYTDELFTEAEISFRHDGDGVFTVGLRGKSIFKTTFDISFSAPLTVDLVAYRNSATRDEMLDWFDRGLRKDDFVFTQKQIDDDLYLKGTVR